MPFLFAKYGALFFQNVDRTLYLYIIYINIINELRKVEKWLSVNKVFLNAKKTKFMAFDYLDNLDVINITTNNNSMLTIKEKNKDQMYNT